MSTGIGTGRSNGEVALPSPQRAVVYREIPASTSRSSSRWSDRKTCLLISTTAAVLFAALFNQYWVPSGDGDLYVAIARSLAMGEGFRFNGQYVNISPPGWPAILALVAKVSPTFAAFKVVTIASMLGSLAVWYYVLRRLLSQRGAAGVVLLSAILVHVYSLTFWTHSEAIFCLASTLSLLIGYQIVENRGGLGWRVPLLLALCAACVLIRWAGVLQCLLVCGLLMHNLRWWRAESLGRWGMCAAVFVVTFGTFNVIRNTLALTKEQEVAQAEAGAVFDEGAAPTPRPSVTADSRKLDIVNMPTGEGGVGHELRRRLVESGTWFSWLFWQPFRFASAVPALAWTGIAAGWVVIVALGAKLVESVRTRQWLWLGLAAYCAALCINWPNANARYLVPVVPLLLAGTIKGIKLLMLGRLETPRAERAILISLVIATAVLFVIEFRLFLPFISAPLMVWLGEMSRSIWFACAVVAGVWALRLWARSGGADRPARVAKVLVGTFVLTVGLVNAGLYAIDLRVFRSGDFYASYEAGANLELIQNCHQLNQLGVKDAELAVSERYVNLGKVRKSKYAVRAAVLLTGRSVQTTKDKLAGEPRKDLLEWCRKRRVTYYIDQRPNVPWRVWHFVLPRSWNEKLVPRDELGVPQLGSDDGGWKLYRVNIEQVPVMPGVRVHTLRQRIVGQTIASLNVHPLPTHPGYEFRRSATLLPPPNVRDWPTRVPGL